MKWGGQVDLVRFAEMARSYQRHAVANAIEDFKSVIIGPDGAIT